MDILFLAAGAGRRMKHLSEDRPKALVAVDGSRPILGINTQNAIELFSRDLRIMVCGGHCYSSVTQFVRRHNESGSVASMRSVFNPAYLSEGPLRSVAIGLDALGHEPEALIVANGDTCFDEEVFTVARELGRGQSALVVSRDPAPEADDMIVDIADGRIASVSKRFGTVGASVVSSGFLIVKGHAAMADFRIALAKGLAAEERSGKLLPWHSLIAYFCEGASELTPAFVARDSWHEFDTPECIDKFVGAGASRVTPIHIPIELAA